MSKLNTRVVFAVLITLVVIAGVFTSAQGASLNAGTKSGQVHVDAGLMPDLSHHRGSTQELQSYMPQADNPGRTHDCHSDSRVDPND